MEGPNEARMWHMTEQELMPLEFEQNSLHIGNALMENILYCPVGFFNYFSCYVTRIIISIQPFFFY